MARGKVRWIVVGCLVGSIAVGCGNSDGELVVVEGTGGGYSVNTTIGTAGAPMFGSSGAASRAAGSGGLTAICSEIGQHCLGATECCSGRCDFGLCLGDTGLCSSEGATCAASAECCSGRCESMGGAEKTCVASSGTCTPGGGTCGSAADCCSGVCGDDGFCPVFAQCQTAGEPCTGHHECCTGACADPGTGSPVCQYVGGCRPIGEVCDDAHDCCSSLCQLDGTNGVSRCTKPAGCMLPGEVCWTGQAANCCPQGREGGNSLCQPSVIGVSRCFTVGTTTDCLENGEACAFGDECCGGRCLPDSTGALTCSSECIPIGGQWCTSAADCCAGVCAQGSCVPASQQCVALGRECTSDAECCTGLCADGHCAVGIVLL